MSLPALTSRQAEAAQPGGLRAARLGGALVIMPRFEPDEFLRLIERERIDTIFMVPTMFIRLMKLPETTRRKYDMSSLRHLYPLLSFQKMQETIRWKNNWIRHERAKVPLMQK